MAMKPPEARMTHPRPLTRPLMSPPTGHPTRKSQLTKRRRNRSPHSDPSHRQRLPLPPLHTQPLHPTPLPPHLKLHTHHLQENQTILQNQRTYTKHQRQATLLHQKLAILLHRNQAMLPHQNQAIHHLLNLATHHQNLATRHHQSQATLRHQNRAILLHKNLATHHLLNLATPHQNLAIHHLLNLASLHQSQATIHLLKLATPPPRPRTPLQVMTAPLASIPITTRCRRLSPRPGRRGRATPRRAATQSCSLTAGL